VENHGHGDDEQRARYRDADPGGLYAEAALRGETAECADAAEHETRCNPERCKVRPPEAPVNEIRDNGEGAAADAYAEERKDRRECQRDGQSPSSR
jgi:hypothetical protein